MAEPRKTRRLNVELSEQDLRLVIEVRSHLIREGRTLREWIAEAIRDKAGREKPQLLGHELRA